MNFCLAQQRKYRHFLYFHSLKFVFSFDLHYFCIARTRQASLQCLNRRVVFLYAMRYNKQYSAPEELITLLRERGLIIEQEEAALRNIRSIGYYRLSAYLHPFLRIPKTEHVFKEGTTFGQAMSIYDFDRGLRLLIFDQIERIEIAVRSAIVNITCRDTNNPFWMTSPDTYAHNDKFQKTLQLIDKELQTTREDFIKHFKDTYTDHYPPSWMLAEILPFGVLTRVYENIASNQIRKSIARYFGLNVPVFTSWLTIVAVTRNACCHHARLWNRKLSIRALLMSRWNSPWISESVQQGRIFFTLCILKHFMDVVHPQNTLKEDLKSLLQTYPMIDVVVMGFPKKWEEEPLWR